MLVGSIESELDSALNTISEDWIKFRFHIFFLVERLRLELRYLLSQVDGLATRSNTVMGPFHYTQLLFSNNICGPWSECSSVEKVSSFLNTASSNFWRSLPKMASHLLLYSSWATLNGRGLLPLPDMTISLIILMAESRGVEPHPISENLVFKASRRTIPAALSSINLVPRDGIEPPTPCASNKCSTNWAISAIFFGVTYGIRIHAIGITIRGANRWH